MYKSSKFLVVLFSMLATGTIAAATNGGVQKTTAGGYTIMTDIVVGSPHADTGTRPVRKISPAIEAVRKDFEFASYSGGIRHFQSIGDGGSISFENMLQNLGSFAATDNPIFTEWSYGGFYVDKETPASVGFKSFRFHARIPVKYRGIQNEANSTTFVKYENIRLSLNNIVLNLGAPKVIASLPMPENGESLFFVIEVRKAETQ
ncbi:MAG: hypothetical protein OEM82_09470 [Acidobacteriota bacterium]|nr:hypothetical protein [Acidobacteriota bacterium]